VGSQKAAYGQSTILTWQFQSNRVQIFTSDTSEAVINGLGWDGAHFYVGRQDSPQKLYKLDTSFGLVETITLSNLNTAAVNDLTFMNGHAYVADTGGYVHDYLVADWAWQTAVGGLDTSGVGNPVSGITNDGTSLWMVEGHSTVKSYSTSFAHTGLFYTMLSGSPRFDGIAYDGMHFFIFDYSGPNQIVKYPKFTSVYTSDLGSFQAFASGDGRGMTFTWEDRTTPTLWLNARNYGIWKFQ